MKIVLIQKLARGFITRNKLRTSRDNMTLDILKELIDRYKSNYIFIENINKKLSTKKCRNENFPSHISENIVKFVMYKKYNVMPNWDTKVGDLEILSKKIEVKAFMSSGPSSFGPSENWHWIYFVDCMDFMNDNFKVYEIKLSNKSQDWRNIIFSKKSGSFGVIADANNRGKLRASFYSIIKSQLGDKCNLIFDGNFNEL